MKGWLRGSIGLKSVEDHKEDEAKKCWVVDEKEAYLEEGVK